MRIATLSNAAVGHTQGWVEWFRGRGHEVRVWSLERGPESLGARALPAAPLPGFLRYPLAVPRLRAELAAFSPDVVDAHYVPNYGLMGALAGRRPLAVTAWGSDLLLSGGAGALRRARTRWVLERADLVLADAANLGAAAVRLGAAPERVHVVPWGVDRGLFRAAPERERGLIATTRMHEPVYDLPTVLRGLAGVLARHPEARAEIAGSGSLTAELEALAARLLPAGRWAFTGRLARERMAALLGRAEVYLSASLSDSTSVSLLEAMSAGAVPVVSDLEGNREWVEEGAGAKFFPPGDAATLERALEGALADDAWRASARAHNERVIAARGDRALNMARIEALFEGLVARAGRGGAA